MNFFFRAIKDDIYYTAIDVNDMKKINLLFFLIYVLLAIIIVNYYILWLAVLFYLFIYFYIDDNENKSLYFLWEADFLLKIYFLISCVYIFYLWWFEWACIFLLIPAWFYGYFYRKWKKNLIDKYYCWFMYFILKELSWDYENYYKYNFKEILITHKNENLCVINKSDKKILLEAEKDIIRFVPLIPYLIYVNIVWVIIILFLTFLPNI